VPSAAGSRKVGGIVNARYRADEATVTVTPHGSRLLVRWQSDAHFHAILAGFRAALPRHGDCCYNSTARAWSVTAYGAARDRLERWLSSTFEPSAIMWDDAEPAGYRYRHHSDEGRTHGDGAAPGALERAYSTLCLTPDAPAGLVTAAHHWWAKQLHPDCGAGGDGEAMAAVNGAVDVIRQHHRLTRKAS
jgi:hypothetical protein